MLQITAVCAILVHDLLVRYGSIAGDRSWMDTAVAVAITVVGGTLSAGGSNAINMWYDADIDPLMSRTSRRPIPSGEIAPRAALLFGLTIAVLGRNLPSRSLEGGILVGVLRVLLVIYTVWPKRRSPQNIVIGGIAGATPPSSVGRLPRQHRGPRWHKPVTLGSLFLDAVHAHLPVDASAFLGPCAVPPGEYAKAKVPMMNEVRGAESTIRQSKARCGLLLLLGSVPCFWPASGMLLWAFTSGARFGTRNRYGTSTHRSLLTKTAGCQRPRSPSSVACTTLVGCSFPGGDFSRPSRVAWCVGLARLKVWRSEGLRSG